MRRINLIKTSTAICALALTGAILIPSVAVADASLTSADGAINVSGQILSFDGTTYKIRTSLGDLSVAAASVTCDGDDCPTDTAITADVLFAGSDTVGLGLMPLLLQGYAGQIEAEAEITDTGVQNEIMAKLVSEEGFGEDIGTFQVTSTGSSDAFRALLANTAQIGMASRRIRPEEARALRDSGAGNMVKPGQEHILAVDSLIVITNPNNPVDRLTMDQLADIYAGTITNWSQVGGEDLPIKVGTRPESSGTLDVFKNRIFTSGDAAVRADAVVQVDHDAMAEMVNLDRSAIGFVGYAFQRGAKALTLINDCGLEMSPDAFSARTEEYALQRRLYLYNRADAASPQASGFLDFALSETADSVISKAGFIDLGIDRRPQSLQSDRGRALLNASADVYESSIMHEMLGTMTDYDRLSTTIRFASGSSRLDERAALDINRLINFLETKPAGTRVMFVGFTDDVGNFTGNRSLSETRAAHVMSEVKAVAGDRLAGIEMSTSGFGEIAPTACNSREEGRKINRRVEVWISADS